MAKFDADLRLLYQSLRRVLEPRAAQEISAMVDGGQRDAALERLLRVIEREGLRVSPSAGAVAYGLARRMGLDLARMRERWGAAKATASFSFENQLKEPLRVGGVSLAPRERLELSVTAGRGKLLLEVSSAGFSLAESGECRYKAVYKGRRAAGMDHAEERPGLVSLSISNAGRPGFGVAFEPQGELLPVGAGESVELEAVPEGRSRCLALHAAAHDGRLFLSLWPDRGTYRAAFKGVDVRQYAKPT